MTRPFILLSFDVEEFDVPLEYKQSISEEEQMLVGFEGLEILMDMIGQFSVESTFFTTANFAKNYSYAIRTISEKHEIASHTFYHSHFKTDDLVDSKKVLETITRKEVAGIRMPQMRPVQMKDVLEAGYSYDSSINPTYIPGRYNNRHLQRTPYKEEGVLRFPASVTPNLRIPLFWLTFKNFPYALFLKLLKTTLKKDGYVCLYFHPWEFTELTTFQIPGYIKRDSGKAFQKKFRRLLADVVELGECISMVRYINAFLMNK